MFEVTQRDNHSAVLFPFSLFTHDSIFLSGGRLDKNAQSKIIYADSKKFLKMGTNQQKITDEMRKKNQTHLSCIWAFELTRTALPRSNTDSSQLSPTGSKWFVTREFSAAFSPLPSRNLCSIKVLMWRSCAAVWAGVSVCLALMEAGRLCRLCGSLRHGHPSLLFIYLFIFFLSLSFVSADFNAHPDRKKKKFISRIKPKWKPTQVLKKQIVPRSMWEGGRETLSQLSSGICTARWILYSDGGFVSSWCRPIITRY